MFTIEQLNQNHILMIANFKKLIAEVVNATPNELRVCDRLDPRGVMISDGNIVLATGKRVDGYTIRKFFEAFESTLDSFNKEVVEQLTMHLQMDAMKYPSICMDINSSRCNELILEKMWYHYQVLYQHTKYKAIKVGLTCVAPRTEFYRIPFVFDILECHFHEFFNLNYVQYINCLEFICNGGSVRKEYENVRCAVRRNEADKAKARREAQRNVAASKSNDHLKQGRVNAPTQRVERKIQ